MIDKIAQQQFFEYNDKLELESGQSLPRLTLAYHTFGKLNSTRSNVVWIVHALTADSNPTAWWKGIVGPGLAIDTNRLFVVCANMLGSHYGSTSPLSIDQRTGKSYYHDFPLLTNRDVVKSYKLLADHLDISEIAALVGPSLGGQQALEWAIMYPTMIKNLIPIATNAVHSSYGIAFNESQRMAIDVDPTWQLPTDDAGLDGLKVARSIALLSYRTKHGYDTSQKRSANAIDNFKASSYQQYQGEKVAKRFNTYSYYLLTKMMDSHDLARERVSLPHALQQLTARTTIISITTDVLFPPEEQKLLHQYISDSKLVSISSGFGHDGFLIENEKMTKALEAIINDLLPLT